jgi:hypothetical protein
MNDMTTINPFQAGAQVTAARSTAVAQTDASRAIAEVQAAMMIARMNPRDPVAAVDRILNACARPSLAEAALYQYSRGGSDVSGPSIRLAEAMAQQWGNLKTSVRELEQANGSSVVQAIAWDLETGYQCDKVFHVAHERHTKNGVKKLTDPRDVYELVANQAARRLRACILAVIPGDVTEAAVKQCETTLHTSADTSPETVAKMVAAFASYGVTKEHIETRIQRRLDAIQPAQVVALKKIYASLRDGMSSPGDWFDVAQSTEPPDAAIAAINAKVKPKRHAPIDVAPAAGAMTYAQVRDALENAKSDDDRALAVDMIRSVPDEGQRTELAAIAKLLQDVPQ